MFKSLQTKLILVMFVTILFVILFSAFFSIIRMEQVYYRGFEQEMLNTILGFGINNHSDSQIDKNPKGPIKDEDILDINKLKANFSIYFSLNNNMRFGTILDKDNNVLYTNNPKLNKEYIISKVQTISNAENSYQLINDSETNEYYFIYFYTDYNVGNFTFVIEQDKTYIISQLKEITLFYVATIIIIQ